uniref:Uncharacterized protein n=1 Tax=Meloidogyne enterolobii TaxID=390850 RepID=A0A6V7VEL4_MELEN|nr:unnamed protein product [Meloidogyne enterolobii]
MQRYQPENFLTLNSKKSSTNKNTFNNLITIKATIIGLFFLCQFIVNSAAPIPRSRYNNYPAVDLSDLEWPEAQPIQLLNENGVVSVVECYTELDASFINSNIIYRLNNTAEVRDRSCVVRLPTHMILTIIDIKTHDDNSYVTVMAGSSKIIMPLSINHIRSEKQRFGPYHIPCEKSYLIFNTNQLSLEWVEFKLEPEQPEDMEDNEEKICSDQGLNLVAIEYNNENRDGNESGSIDSKRR